MSRVAQAMKRESLLLRQHTNRLLGQPHTHRHTRFMVTFPSECGADYALVRDLLLRGMDCARINLSHDDIGVWEQMADNVRRACKETGRRCKILMDLAGPKLRTGSISPAPPVLHLRPKHDAEGKLLQPAQVVLDGSGAPGRPGRRDELGNALPPGLAVDAAWVAALKPGDEVHFRDLRGSRRTLVIQAPAGTAQALALCGKGAWVAPGTVLEYQPRTKSRHAKRTECGAYAAAPADIRLCRGDGLLLTPAATPGEPAQLDSSGRVVAPAHVPCAVPEVFAHLRAGAVETGYEHLAEKQEEILWLCEAAHVPVVWATQVLESMVKEGRPSRAGMTDAAMAGRAECIMLNKGPYILDALSVLDKIVVGMQSHQLKKTAQFRPLRW
jgi:pyruvate kinase